MTPSVNGAMLREAGDMRTTVVLVHLRKLLRVRNRLRSPLLRLPTETILRILSYFMADLDSRYYTPIWTAIYSTCHRIHETMCGATELWWKVDCARHRAAHAAFVRSGGNPHVIVSNLDSVSDWQVTRSENILDHWREKGKFRGDRLHTLEFIGAESSFTHFSWILERPLPRLERLKINVMESINRGIDPHAPGPVFLQLPTNMPLQVLDLRNTMLPWSSCRFTGLRELHLNFRDCPTPVTFPEDELFGLFDASPQLERLSLVQVGHEPPVIYDVSLPPNRILQFPNLTFLKLENNPVVVEHTLTYMDLPVIASLEIRSLVPLDLVWTPDRLFHDDRLPARLFPIPPTFAVRTTGEQVAPSIKIEIGNAKIQLDFYLEDFKFGRNVVMSGISQLVPPSVTALNLDCTQLDERIWRDFFMSHPEVRSIECTEYCRGPVDESLWDALSPAEVGDTGIPCPRLESVSVGSYTGEIGSTPLANCLRSRQTAGFKLKYLKITDHWRLMTCRYAEEFVPLVEVVEADEPNEYKRQVSPVSTDELSVC